MADALDMEPQRSDALGMLQRLDQQHAPRPVEIARPEFRRDGFIPAPVESLAGLSREAGHEFVLKVQPILRNKCGNAGTHVRAGNTANVEDTERIFVRICGGVPGEFLHEFIAAKYLESGIRDGVVPLKTN